MRTTKAELQSLVNHLNERNDMLREFYREYCKDYDLTNNYLIMLEELGVPQLI